MSLCDWLGGGPGSREEQSQYLWEQSQNFRSQQRVLRIAGRDTIFGSFEAKKIA